MEPETEAIRRTGLHEVVNLTEPDDDREHPPRDPEFFLLMSRRRAGDEEAAAEVFQRFVTRLIALASRQFEARLQGKADPEDVVQSVYKSFFRRDDRSPFELSDWEALWALLATITVRKCRRRRGFWRAARRDPRRETVSSHDPMAEAWLEAIERGPTPLQATILAETLEQLLRPLDPSDRAIAELSFQGYTAVEVADRCDCSERTVRRVMTRIRTRISKIEAAEPLG